MRELCCCQSQLQAPGFMGRWHCGTVKFGWKIRSVLLFDYMRPLFCWSSFMEVFSFFLSFFLSGNHSFFFSNSFYLFDLFIFIFLFAILISFSIPFFLLASFVSFLECQIAQPLFLTRVPLRPCVYECVLVLRKRADLPSWTIFLSHTLCSVRQILGVNGNG